MNAQERVWKIAALVGILLAVFLAVISVKELKSIGYVGKDTPVMNSISVNGKGETVSIPDIATFSFTVNETSKNVDDARKLATDKIDATLKAVKEQGVEDKDIKTISYSINPHWDYQGGSCAPNSGYCAPGKSVLTGYNVSQTIQVKIRKLENAGTIFAAVGSTKVENLNGLQFTIDDYEKVKAVARELAIKDAQAKAKQLAKQLGVRIVRITGYYDNSDQPIYYGREEMAMDGASVKNQVSSAPQVPLGEQEVVSNVTITYEIK
ncbi:MAG: SIMPL domain-containing protein [bacterium]|nr:SIMPL domain-containing protein [bacterium]